MKQTNEKPCLFLDKCASEEKPTFTKPGVECALDCRNCGWNPAETRRRFVTGEFRKRFKRVLVGKEERTIQVLQLVFRRRGAEAGNDS